MGVSAEQPLTALLGPTNTGKTHRAVERMLEHETGMIGLPLRLLAREVYDRVSARIGEGKVALVTGEEKRIPGAPRYWVCTVEAMPEARGVDFLAVDEIQLAAHRERGHVFTDRLLRARGRRETWFLGSDSMRPLVERLLGSVRVERHPRLSRLTHAGQATIGQLPPRSAVVAFSMARVYELAERLRRRRGGAAVVLGALSPRARNAQVAMYQSGEVEHMVATDAIGMGLNLDLDHVAFADVEKFDGKRTRHLEPTELAQIAGRAGRYQNDGTFGTLAPEPALPEGLVRRIERHKFDPEALVYFRSSELRFDSVAALLDALRAPPHLPELRAAEQADDHRALSILGRDPEVLARADGSERVRLLWESCQIPDYCQLAPEAHARLVRDVFLRLVEHGKIADDHLARQLSRLDDATGDIDALLQRMAFIRTWTYVANHGDWVNDTRHWQDRTRQIEDRLSDALHARLVERFVERGRPTKPRAPDGVLARALARSDHDGAFARLLARGEPNDTSSSDAAWIAKLPEIEHERVTLDRRGLIRVDGRPVAQLVRGGDVLRPEVKLRLGDDIPAGIRQRVQRRLVAYGRDVVAELFAPLRSSRAASLSTPARGLVYQLEQALGTLLTHGLEATLDALTAEDRLLLGALGVVFGRRAVYLGSALGPAALEWRAALHSAWSGQDVEIPSSASVPVGRLPKARRDALLRLGYLTLGPRATRVDVADPPRKKRRRRRRRGGGGAPRVDPRPDGTVPRT